MMMVVSLVVMVVAAMNRSRLPFCRRTRIKRILRIMVLAALITLMVSCRILSHHFLVVCSILRRRSGAAMISFMLLILMMGACRVSALLLSTAPPTICTTMAI